jgi:hypothetical protein
MPEIKRFSLVKPSIQTPFHIDFDWWKNQDKNWQVYLFSYLCPIHKEAFSVNTGPVSIDWVDPETAEVFQVDGIQHTLMTHCAKQDSFVTLNTSLVDAVFRILLTNGNNPLTPEQLGQSTGRPPDTILRTLSGVQIYKGIRPLQS